MNVNAGGSMLTPIMGYKASIGNAADNFVSIRLHPMQSLAVAMLYTNVVRLPWWVRCKMRVKRFFTKKNPYSMTFMGRILVEDVSMPENEIHFIGKNNEVIAKIQNLGLPEVLG